MHRICLSIIQISDCIFPQSFAGQSEKQWAETKGKKVLSSAKCFPSFCIVCIFYFFVCGCECKAWKQWPCCLATRMFRPVLVDEIKKRSINVAGLSLSICYPGTNFYFSAVIYHNKFCSFLYLQFSSLNKSITKTWGYVWYNRKCNYKKKHTRIEIIWLLTILLSCLRQLHISIELFYDQASMLLKYYLFSLSHSDKKWQDLGTVILMEYKIWGCGECWKVEAKKQCFVTTAQPIWGFSLNIGFIYSHKNFQRSSDSCQF